jgi:alkylhydroperoxidase family enzyme
MTHTPVEVPDELFQRLRAQFTEAQLVELTATIAWENYRARFNHAFGLEAEGFSEGSYCALPVGAASHH